MKSLLKKILVLVLTASVLLSLLSCVTFAEPDNAGANGTTGTTQEEIDTEVQTPTDGDTDVNEGATDTAAFDGKVSSDFAYKNYIAEYVNAARPKTEIVLSGKDAVEFDAETGKIKGSLPIVIASSDNNPTDKREGALFYDEGICGWTVTVPETGLYNLTFSYFAYESIVYEKDGVQYTADSKSSAVQRKFYIDGAVPFYEARQVNFERVWKDAGVLRIDSQTGNEKRPYQEETGQWQTVELRDYMGYEQEPFAVYLEKGTHTLCFEAIKEGMLVEKAVLHQVESAPSYAELKKEYESKGYTKVTGVSSLYIQAEGIHNPDAYSNKQSLFVTTDSISKYNGYIDPTDTTAYDATKDITYDILKSSPTLYAITDRSSPVSAPYHHSKIRYNTIGADKWQSPNEWIEWSFNVEKAGLYAVTFKARQNTLNGMYTTRKLTINGVQPCAEAGNLTFDYSNSFANYTLGDEENGTYYFYFNEGKNTIRLETTLGDLGDMLAKAQASLTQLNVAYRRILMITGSNPDTNANYMLNTMVPDALNIIKEEYDNLEALEQEFISVFGKSASAQLSSLKSMMLILEQINDDYNRVNDLFTNFKDAIAAMGTWINDMSKNPLELDYIVISPEETTSSIPNADAGFFAKLLHEVRAFIASFTEDYDNIGGTVASDGQEPVEVWLETGAGLTGSRDNATILKQLIDDMFTDKTGITVSTRLVAGGSLLPSILSGIGPDVCLSRGAENAVNYALRGAVMNLADEDLFPDYKEVLQDTSIFSESAIQPFSYGNNIYAIPETQDFYMVFYRTDILEEMGLQPPETWDDVYNIIGELQNQQMTFAMPVPVVGAVGSGDMSYAMFLFQKGGKYYTDDLVTTDLASDAALDAFKEWTQFYTLYDLPNTYDFSNRFRTGEVPVGIASYSQYSQLAVFAPEIQGLWEFAMVPGTIQRDANGNKLLDENGNVVIDHSCASSVSGCVMLSVDKNTEEGRTTAQRAWEFMKWWTGEDAQYRFGTEIESLLGAAARYQTANRKAMAKLPWDKKSMSVIQEQWSHVKAVPQVPGGYYTSRNIEFAWKEVINNDTDPNTTFVEYVSKINQEIARKRDEFADKIAEITKPKGSTN